jgi:hypothetical protein
MPERLRVLARSLVEDGLQLGEAIDVATELQLELEHWREGLRERRAELIEELVEWSLDPNPADFDWRSVMEARSDVERDPGAKQ